MNIPSIPTLVIAITLIFSCSSNLTAQNATKNNTQMETEISTPQPDPSLIETNKKVFFDVDWKTWFIIRGTKNKSMNILLFGNQPLYEEDIYINSGGTEKQLDKINAQSKSKIRYKTIAQYPYSNTALTNEIYLRDSAGIISNKIPIEIAYRRFDSFRPELEVLRQDVEFERIVDGRTIDAAVTKWSLGLNVHIIDLGIGVAGLSAQYRIGKSFSNTSSETAIADFARKNSGGYFFKLKPIRVRRLLLAPYYTRRFYTDEYTFRGDNLEGDNTYEIRTQEDQFGIQAFLLAKNKAKKEHRIITLKAFYQYASQTNVTDFRLVDKSGFGMTLYYSFWLTNEIL